MITRREIASRLIGEAIYARHNSSDISYFIRKNKILLALKLAGIEHVIYDNSRVVITNSMLLYTTVGYTEYTNRTNIRFRSNTLHQLLNHLEVRATQYKIDCDIIGGSPELHSEYIEEFRKNIDEIVRIVLTDETRINIARTFLCDNKGIYSISNTCADLLMGCLDEKEQKIVKMEQKLSSTGNNDTDFPMTLPFLI